MPKTYAYALVSGSYSDYSVHAIFSTRELAEQTATLMNEDQTIYGGYDVEEIDYFDRLPQRFEVLTLTATIHDDGVVIEDVPTSTTQWECDYWLLSSSKKDFLEWSWRRSAHLKSSEGRLMVRGTDHERVRRVYSDRKAQLLAEDAFRLKREAGGKK